MRSCCITDVGQKRTTNQDFVYASEEAVGNLPNLFVVADGMGGHKAGDFASRYAVETMLKSMKINRDRNPVRIIRTAIETANTKVLSKANSDANLAGMGTTMVVATVIGRTMYVANVGDSRLYLFRNQMLEQITKDHSLVEEMIRIGEINREQARNHPDKNIITRAVGVSRKVSIDFFEQKLEKKDKILMCSDGLSNMIEDKEMEKIIKDGSDLPEIALTLIGEANQNGGKDNIAVVLVEPLADEVEEC